MDKEFNIFGEFDSVEKKYLESISNEEINSGSEEDDEDLDALIASKAEEAKSKSKTIEDDEQEDEEDDSEEDKSKQSQEESDDDDEIENDEEQSSKSEGYSFKALASYLADEGVIDFEDSEDLEDSPDVISNAVLNTAKNMLSEYKDSLPEEGRKYLEYLEKGGDPVKYLQKTQTSSVLDLDIEDKENQKRILSEYLAKSDYDEDEIKEIIDDYEDGLILEKQAKLALKRLEKIAAKEKEQLLEEQNKQIEEQKVQYQKQIKELEDTIENSDKIAGISLSKAERKSLRSYLLDRDSDGLTKWNRDLKDGGIKTQIALAYLQMKNFDLNKLTKTAATEVTQKYKQIFDGKDTTVKGRSQKVERSGKGDISAFKKILG